MIKTLLSIVKQIIAAIGRLALGNIEDKSCGWLLVEAPTHMTRCWNGRPFPFPTSCSETTPNLYPPLLL